MSNCRFPISNWVRLFREPLLPNDLRISRRLRIVPCCSVSFRNFPFRSVLFRRVPFGPRPFRAFCSGEDSDASESFPPLKTRL